MDQYLYDYLLSVKHGFWLVPARSIEMGYLSWVQLADISLNAIKLDKAGTDISKAISAKAANNFPEVFNEEKKYWGGQDYYKYFEIN